MPTLSGARLDAAEVVVEDGGEGIDREAQLAVGVLAEVHALVAGLGHAEGVDDEHRGLLLAQAVLHVLGEERAGGRQREHRRRVVGACRCGLPSSSACGHRARHRVADDRQHADALAFDQRPDLVRVEAAGLREDDLAAAVQSDQRRPVAVAVHEWRDGQRHRRVRVGGRVRAELFGFGDVGAAGVAALQSGEEDVLVPPHHALRHAGRAAGVEEVHVVAGAVAEVAGRGLVADCGFVFHRGHAGRSRSAPLHGQPSSSTTIRVFSAGKRCRRRRRRGGRTRGGRSARRGRRRRRGSGVLLRRSGS